VIKRLRSLHAYPAGLKRRRYGGHLRNEGMRPSDVVHTLDPTGRASRGITEKLKKPRKE
jgi:hypothetical protein